MAILISEKLKKSNLLNDNHVPAWTTNKNAQKMHAAKKMRDDDILAKLSMLLSENENFARNTDVRLQWLLESFLCFSSIYILERKK